MVASSTLCWASHSCHSLQPTLVKENPDLLENMDLNGTWQVYAQENYEEFLRAMGEKRGYFDVVKAFSCLNHTDNTA